MSFKQFYTQRMKRLLPLTALSAIVFVVLDFLYKKVYGEYWWKVVPYFWGILANALGIQAGWVTKKLMINNPTWYISVLLLCYAIFYMATYLSRMMKISSRYFYIAMVFIGVAISAYEINLPFLNPYSCRGYYSFFYGVLFATYRYNKEVSVKEFMIALFASAFVVLNIIYNYEFISYGIVWIVTGILYPAIIVIFSEKRVKKLFKHSIWKTLGEISFNMYIWHICVFLMLFVLDKNFALGINYDSIRTMLIATIAATIAGVISYYCIEKPIQKRL